MILFRLWCFSISTINARILHYWDVTMGGMASEITSLTIVYPIVYSGADQRIYQNSASMAFAREIHRWSVNSPHKWPTTRKMFPFDDVIMKWRAQLRQQTMVSWVQILECRQAIIWTNADL